ncbi:MAG: pyridoxamine 5'-phosphate oxidase [Gammaproteobacteria bacterium]|nr:pyridoxamine 5'-phosphate oxidase [Gammaproteobacteria bacterium]
MTLPSDLAHIRREYESKPFNEADCHSSPLQQFMRWFEEWQVVKPIEPTAMVLSTVDMQGYPDSRVVLLKGLWQEQFLFYTHYSSTKGKQIAHESHVSLNFYWPDLSRQVRVLGVAKPLPTSISDEYFSSRPFASQCSAVVSPQSQEISSRDELELNLNAYMNSHQGESIVRPEHWGGYGVTPTKIEFWQGRVQRLHDRIQYTKEGENWAIRRLAP